MAQETITIGAENAGDGDTMFAAFTKVQANFTELYNDDAADVNSVTATAPLSGTSTTGDLTLSLLDNGVTLAKMAGLARGKFIYGDASGDPAALAVGAVGKLLVADVNGDPSWTSVSGDATLSAGALSIATDAVVTAKILDANVTHAKLENRYTAINVIGPTSGAFNIDWSLGTIQTVTLGGAHTGTFINFKVGQTIDIVITGNYTLTFDATSSGTAAMRKVGGVDYDGSATQIIQVVCASADSTTPIFYYNCATWVTDTQP